MNMRWIMPFAALIVMAGCGGDTELLQAQRPASVSTATETLQALTVPVVLETTGSVQPWARISPGTKIMGRVARVDARAGDRVRVGQQLAVLEKKDLEASTEQATAALTMAEANFANANIQYQRMTDLHARGSVTDKNLDDATTGFKVSKAAVVQAQAALKAAQEMLQYATILSPVDGWVTEKFVEPGNIIAPGSPMFTLEDLSRVKIIAHLPESDASGIEAGDSARVLVNTAGFDQAAMIDRILPAADANTRTFRMELILDNSEALLKSGMFARVLVSTTEREALTVPATAIVARGSLQGIFAVGEDGVAHLRWIRVGRSFGDRVEAISGLRAGDRIVVEPPPELTDGTPVG